MDWLFDILPKPTEVLSGNRTGLCPSTSTSLPLLPPCSQIHCLSPLSKLIGADKVLLHHRVLGSVCTSDPEVLATSGISGLLCRAVHSEANSGSD